MNVQTRFKQAIDAIGLDTTLVDQGDLAVHSPVDGSCLGHVQMDSREAVDEAIKSAHSAYLAWRVVPAPRRGELVRLFGDSLREHKEALGALVTLECGKIYQEGLGEVQEMIDICDFAVGLSRQLYGLTMPSERPGHKMSEYWHPVGTVGVISAFNFPVAVWAWNAALALVCGDAVVWKPSEKTPITALACMAIFAQAAKKFGGVPEGLVSVVIGERAVGEQLVDDPRIPVISATGSTRMGREVGPRVAQRFGRSILELGGNNAMVVTPSADLDMAVRAILFSAVGTAGQRCTTLRRLIVHESIREELVTRLEKVYQQLTIGDPFDAKVLVGPLIDPAALQEMQNTLGQARSGGCKVVGGDPFTSEALGEGAYVHPAIVHAEPEHAWVQKETFAPILYVLSYSDLDEAIEIHNGVPQGLSSCIFTRDLLEAERFVSAAGSDCGIANVNIGPSGAEIGGAFGGEKETGGGRESGSDAWKAYMRRMTATVNYSKELPLAQGIEFGLGD